MKHTSQNITVCISGIPSPEILCPPESLDIGKSLGRICREYSINIMTTSTTGFPLWVALAASGHSTESPASTTIAFSPAASEREHAEIFRLPREGFDHIIYTGFGTSGASVLALRSSDAIIFGCGGMSSVLECVTAIQEGKPIGILEGPWETDEVIKEMLDKYYPDYEHILIDSDPRRLVDQIIKKIKNIKTLLS